MRWSQGLWFPSIGTRRRTSLSLSCGARLELGVATLLGVATNIEVGQWHSLKSLESGTVLFEAKDGPYTPQSPEDVLTL